MRLQNLNDYFPWEKPKQLAASILGLSDFFYYDVRLEWLKRAGLGKPIFWSGSEAFTELEKKRLLHPRLRNRFAGFSSWEAIQPIYSRFQEKAWERSHLNWMSYIDLNLRLPELLLMRVDKMSMGVGLESRVPFLDHKLVELAMSIPSSIKTKGGNLKYILKNTVRGVIPNELIDRKKQGFGVPVQEWFLGRLGDESHRTLLEFCEQTEFLDSSELLRMMQKGKKWKMWYLLNFAMWWNQFIK